MTLRSIFHAFHTSHTKFKVIVILLLEAANSPRGRLNLKT